MALTGTRPVRKVPFSRLCKVAMAVPKLPFQTTFSGMWPPPGFLASVISTRSHTEEGGMSFVQVKCSPLSASHTPPSTGLVEQESREEVLRGQLTFVSIGWISLSFI